jgi:hypothetical protein
LVHGIALARRLGPDIVDKPDYVAILAFLGSRLAGATICQHCPKQDMLRLRFSAVEPDQRRASLSRVVYLEAVALSRRAGHRWTSLGNDTNIYGHIVKPGLLGFKASLGFRPVPSQAVLPGDGNDEADYIVDLRTFTDPTVLLGYPRRAGPPSSTGWSGPRWRRWCCPRGRAPTCTGTTSRGWPGRGRMVTPCAAPPDRCRTTTGCPRDRGR